MGICGMTDLGASPGQMSVIPEGTAAVGDIWSYGCWYAYAAGFPGM